MDEDRNRRAQARRRTLAASRDEIIREEVADALAATPAERMEALIALLDGAYELWVVRGLSRDEGLCRFPRLAQQRRRGLCSDRGIAVLAHIPYRTTRDLDVLIEPTLSNAEKTRRAVAAWGSFEPDYSAADFISGDILSFGGLLRVEIHSRVPGVTWDDVWQGRVQSEFLGVTTSFAGVDELIRMKRATANAEKDLPDLQRLEAIQKSRPR